MPVGVYVHIPFCVRKCPYCDFYSLPFAQEDADDYVRAVLRALETHPFGPLQADTVYFGGGTPTLLGVERLRQILNGLSGHILISHGAEITLEANPAAVTAAELCTLRSAGFNRISFGVQSLNDAELTSLGRLHTAAEAKTAILDAAEAGFADISADLMLAIPGQTKESLRCSIDGLAALPVNHISAYLLKIEEDTPFWSQRQNLSLPGEDGEADLYLGCVRALEQYDYRQYEISNFARGGQVSRHNLRYWQCGGYLGIGPAAHSFLHGRRFYFPQDLHAFNTSPEPFSLTVNDGTGGGTEERLILALRLTKGFDTAILAPDKAKPLLDKARQLEKNGLTRIAGGRVSLTPEGFLLSNSVTSSLLASIA